MKRMSRNQWRYQECEHCGESFRSSRYDAKYCGSTCRSRAQRDAEKHLKRLANLEKAVFLITAKDIRTEEQREMILSLARRLNNAAREATVQHSLFRPAETETGKGGVS